MPDAISAQGTLVSRQVSGSGSFLVVAELRDITPPPLSRNPIETTNHNETEEGFVVGIRRKGELTFQIGYVPGLASHSHAINGLTHSWVNGLRDVWRITFPDTSTWTFSGYVSNISPAAPVDDGLVADITVRPTGVMTFA